MNLLFLLASGLLTVTIVMILTWLLSLKLNNAGIVDLSWTFSFLIVLLVYMLLAGSFEARHLLLACMLLFWSGRLGFYLLLRFLRSFPEEDPRYKELRLKMGDSPNLKMLMVFLWQGLVLVLMTAPIAASLCDPHAEFYTANFLALALFIVAFIGESIADAQLAGFCSKAENKGKACREGLWRYSRHPNYFFEWLISVAFFIYAIASPYGIWTIVCPLIYLHLLINVTGVKPAELHMLKSRSDYKQYQQETSVFIPWFRRTV